MPDDAPVRDPRSFASSEDGSDELARHLLPSDDSADPFDKWMRRLLPSNGDLRSGESTPGPDATPIEEPAPATVGRYAVRAELARGGMGVVYRATDPLLSRDIAIKLMNGWTRLFAPAAQRFLEEARITGQLQHPGIPPVHEIGELPDGSPYLVMKLIKGRTLADRLRDRPDLTADRGQTVAVFEKVCEAIAYAHSRGVIHRDLKPANVMVGAFGEVQVMDWGLAKVLGNPAIPGARPSSEETEGTQIRSQRDSAGSDTQAGSMLGTPAFMPPEQAGGEINKIDTRADVFGLGAILAVILTGHPPYVAEDGEDVRLMAVRGQLAGCLARLESCDAEPGLVALCRQCLAFAPGDRPADAGIVTETVRRLRADAEERARQAEVDRVAAEARAEEEAKTRRVAEEKALEQRKRRRAQVALLAAVGVILLGGVVAAWWQDKQSTTQRAETENREREDRDRAKRNTEALGVLLAAGEEDLRAGKVGKAEAAFAEAGRRIDGEVDEDVRTQLERGRVDLTVLKELDAIDQYRWTPIDTRLPDELALLLRWQKVFELLGAAPGSIPPDTVASRVASSPIRDRLIRALDQWLAVGRSDAVRAVLRAVDPDDFRDKVRDAVLAGDTTAVGRFAAEPAALSQPIRFAIFLGGHAPVSVERRRALLRDVARQHPSDFAVVMTLASNYLTGPPAEAKEGMRWIQAALALAPTNPAVYFNFGIALDLRGDTREAAIAYREATRLNSKYTHAFNNLAVMLARLKDWAGAVKACEEAIRLDPEFPKPRYNLGVALREQGKVKEAIATVRVAIRLDPNYALAHFDLGVSLVSDGDVAGAIAAYKDAIRCDPAYIEARNNLGNLLLGQGKVEEAIAQYREVIRINSKDPYGHYNLGIVLARKRDWDGAIAAYTEAIRADPKFLLGYNNLGLALAAKGDGAGAIAKYKEALAIDPTFAMAHINLGIALYNKRDYDGAIAAYKEAIRHDAKAANAHNNMGNALTAKGDHLAAAAAYREAIRVNPKYTNARISLGFTLTDLGEVKGAVAEYKEAVRHDPKHPFPHSVLAWALATGPDGVRDGKLAVEHARTACELTRWLVPTDLATLAAAHAEAGEFDKAVEYLQKALAVPAFEKRHGVQAREQLSLYTQKKPVRDPSLDRREVAPPPRPASPRG